MRNRNKKSDNLSDVILSKKRPEQADINEIFLNRQNGKVSFKEGINQIQALGEAEVVDFIYVMTPKNGIIKLLPKLNIVNGKSSWGIGSFLMYWDGVDSWVFSVNNNPLYTIQSTIDSEYPPVYDQWLYIPEAPNTRELFAVHVSPDLQTALQDIALQATAARSAYNNVYNNEYSGLSATTVQTAIDELAASGGGSAPTTTVVNISSAQILNMGSSPIELLPAAGVGKYYDIEKVILEFTHVTTAYTLADDYLYTVIPLCTVSSQLITGGASGYAVMSPINNGASNTEPYAFTYPVVNSLNTAMNLTTWLNTDPTLGDGTLRAIITYTLRTFGA